MGREGQTFRVFVSSTFSDLKAERDALQAHVFPRLRELCERHGARFQAIDLRWGVSQQASRDQRTMNICLSEIARCQEVTPRPNFIVLLGDRYGWCPPPPQIPAKEFEKILAGLETEDEHATAEKRLLLWQEDGGEPDDGVEMVQWDDQEQAFVGDKGWYRRDENAEPAEYVLQPWDGFTYEEWEEIEEDLHAALERGARAAGLDDGALFKYWASATHQEIAAGAMSVPDADEHVFAFFRHIDDPPKTEEAEGFIDLVEAEAGIRPDADAKQSLLDLKANLRSTLGEGNVEEYDEVEWADGGPSTDHIDQLCDDVYQALSSVIENQLADLEQIDPLEAEIAAHEAFGEERAEFFTGRAAYLRRIADYVEDASPHPFALWGESGSGKSALLTKAVEETQEAHPEVELIYRFIGATPESSSGQALLEGFCRQISRRYGADESDIPLEYKDLAQEFPRRLALPTAEKPLILFIDALNQLSDMDNAKALTWLPAELPENVRLVVSTVPGDCRDVLERKLPPEGLVQLEPMPEDEAEELLRLWLKDADRELQSEQRRDVLTNPKPLYLKLAFEEARRWHSYDGLPRGADGVPGLSDDIEGVIGDLFARLSAEVNHGEMLVSRSLGYLAAAKNGLTEDELLDVLARDVDVYAWFLSTLFHTPPDLMRAAQAHLGREREEPVSEEAAEARLKRLREGEDEKRLRDFLSAVVAEGDGLRLPVVLWSRLYTDLEPYLTQQSADGTNLLAFYHPTTFGRAVRETYLNEDAREHRHRSLASYFGEQPLVREGAERKTTNLRKLSELPYQQSHGHQWDKVKTTLTDFDFLQAKVSAVGPQLLIQDYDEVNAAGRKDRDLSLVQGAFQLSAHILADDDDQLVGQLVGRLMTQESPAIQGLVKQAKNSVRAPWLRLLSSTLTQAGGPLLRTLEGHSGWVNAVAVTPDGTRAVSASDDNTLKVWDLESGQALCTLEGHTVYVRAVAVTSDGTRAVSSSRDKTVRVWDLQGGQEIHLLEGHTEYVEAVAVTPDGTRAVSASRDGTVKVWNLHSGKEIHTLTGHKGGVYVLAVTPDSSYVISGGGAPLGEDPAVRVWDLQTGVEVYALKGHTSAICALAVTPDGKRAVSGSHDKTVRVWDLGSGEAIHILEGHTDWVYAVAATPDGTRAVSGSRDETLKVWDLDSGAELHTLQGHTSSVHALAVIQDGRRAVSGSYDNTLKLWDLERGEELRTLKGHTQYVEAVAVTHDGSHAISGSRDRTLKIWDLERGKERYGEKEHSYCVNKPAVTPDGTKVVSACGTILIPVDKATGVTPDGTRVVSASSKGTLKIWGLDSRKLVHALQGHMGAHKTGAQIVSGGVHALAVSPEGTRAVSGSSDKTLKMWVLQEGDELHTLEGHTSWVNAVAVTPDGQRAISASSDNTLKVWDLESGEEVHSLEGHTDFVKAIAVTPDGTRATSGAQDWTPRVWDLRSGKAVQTLEGHNTAFIMVTPDGARAITGSHDFTPREHTPKVWNLRTGDLLQALEGHTARVNSMAVTPSGRFAVSGSDDGTVRVWDLQTGEELHCLDGHTGRVRIITVTPDGFRAASVDWRTLRMWDLESGEETAQFTFEYGIRTCATAPDGLTLIARDDSGQVHFLRLETVTPGPAIVTGGRIWRYGRNEDAGQWHERIEATCPRCGERFPVANEVLDVIMGITHSANLPPDQLPCLELPKETWDEPGLLSECPDCHRPLKFNPFIVGPSQTAAAKAAAPAREEARVEPEPGADALDTIESASTPSRSGMVDAAAPEHLKPGARLLWDKMLDTPDRFGHSEPGLNHFLLAVLERHGAMVESLVPGLDARDYGRQIGQRLRAGELGDEVEPEALLRDALEHAQKAGKEQASERDLAAVLLERAGPFRPAKPVEPAPGDPQPVPEESAPPPLPLSFGAEILLQSALRQHSSGEPDELGLHQWLGTLLDEHRGLAEDAAEGRDLDALQSALSREAEHGTPPQDLCTDVLVGRASEGARAAGQAVVRPRDLAAPVLAAAIEATAGTSTQSAAHETPTEAPPLPLSFAAEQMIEAALRFHDAPETGELGANQWLAALLAQHRELLEDVARAGDLKDLAARVRQQLDRGEIGTPLTQEALIDQASRKAQQAGRQVVTPKDVARVILAADPHTSRLMHGG